MLTFAQKYSKNVYSQNGEDGIIEELINRIQPTILTAVEFGAPNWTWCSNTAYLADKGWLVKMYDINPEDPRIEKKEITPQNVNEIGSPTVLSMDCDGPDYYIWKAYNGSPDIVVIEINSSYQPNVYIVPGKSGASYMAMVMLGISKGYELICHTGNLIFVKKYLMDKFPEIIGNPIKDHRLYFNRSWL